MPLRLPLLVIVTDLESVSPGFRPEMPITVLQTLFWSAPVHWLPPLLLLTSSVPRAAALPVLVVWSEKVPNVIGSTITAITDAAAAAPTASARRTLKLPKNFPITPSVIGPIGHSGRSVGTGSGVGFRTFVPRVGMASCAHWAPQIGVRSGVRGGRPASGASRRAAPQTGGRSFAAPPGPRPLRDAGLRLPAARPRGGPSRLDEASTFFPRSPCP